MVRHESGERSFHALHQLCAAPAAIRAALHITVRATGGKQHAASTLRQPGSNSGQPASASKRVGAGEGGEQGGGGGEGEVESDGGKRKSDGDGSGGAGGGGGGGGEGGEGESGEREGEGNGAEGGEGDGDGRHDVENGDGGGVEAMGDGGEDEDGFGSECEDDISGARLASHFRYLCSPGDAAPLLTIPGVSDAEAFLETDQAMRQIYAVAAGGGGENEGGNGEGGAGENGALPPSGISGGGGYKSPPSARRAGSDSTGGGGLLSPLSPSRMVRKGSLRVAAQHAGAEGPPSVWRCGAAVLLLGNIEFVGVEEGGGQSRGRGEAAARVAEESEATLNAAAELLGVQVQGVCVCKWKGGRAGNGKFAGARHIRRGPRRSVGRVRG